MNEQNNDRRAFLKKLATAAIGGATALVVATEVQAMPRAVGYRPNKKRR